MVLCKSRAVGMGRLRQLSFTVDDELRQWLEKSAKAAGNRSVADEIRVRLARSLFADDEYDEPTRQLADDVMELANAIKEQGTNRVAWHDHPQAREALIQAIVTFLESTALPAVDTEFGPDDPLTLGRAAARAYKAQRSAAFLRNGISDKAYQKILRDELGLSQVRGRQAPKKKGKRKGKS